MFLNFFIELRNIKVPVSLREYLSLLNCLDKNVISFKVENFYYLSRASLIKNEKHIDRFDLVFSKVFKGIEDISLEDLLNKVDIPKEWVKKLSEKLLTPEEMEEIKSLGGFDKLMETLKKRLSEQEKRHQGGNKWIGTAGTSPFGAYGYNPEGVRIGQDKSRHKKAIKVWDKREFKDLDDKSELGSRAMKIALKRLRQWARTGLQEEIDIDSTIKSTAKNGYLDIKTQKEKNNSIKVLLFLDVGGSMDPYVKKVEELFSASRSVFKNLEYFYFHNCLYEGVWKNNRRRWNEQIPTFEVLNTYGKEYKCIFVGDASMSPYEILFPGGANEHFNKIAGKDWLFKAISQWESHMWINPVPKKYWDYTQTIKMVSDIFSGKMVPLTLSGLDKGMKQLMI
ncbi:VWA domain-containing protein [SAR116 cluster bacterium]|nr:VWA domain-containing protein [SAR116 cluster bacterium]